MGKGQLLSLSPLNIPNLAMARYWCRLYNGRIVIICYKPSGECWWQVVDAWRVDPVMDTSEAYPMPAWAV